MQVKLTPLNRNEDRLHPRRLVRLRARFQDTGAGSVDALVVDLSGKGCRIEGARELEEGDQFLMRLPGLEAKSCRVVWTDREAAGCEFDAPLYPGELELIRNQAGQSGKLKTGVFGRSHPGQRQR